MQTEYRNTVVRIKGTATFILKQVVLNT